MICDRSGFIAFLLPEGRVKMESKDPISMSENLIKIAFSRLAIKFSIVLLLLDAALS